MKSLTTKEEKISEIKSRITENLKGSVPGFIIKKIVTNAINHYLRYGKVRLDMEKNQPIGDYIINIFLFAETKEGLEYWLKIYGRYIVTVKKE